MINEKDTVYPRIKEEISNKELLDCFTPSENEIAFCRTETRSDNNFICALLILKAFQRYGRAVLLEELSSKIIQYVSEKTSIYLSKENIAEYDSSRIRRHHYLLVKKYLDIKSYTDGGENIVSKIAYDLAKTREDIGDIINGTIDALVRERYELPAFSSLFRICKHERSVVYKEIYNRTLSKLAS